MHEDNLPIPLSQSMRKTRKTDLSRRARESRPAESGVDWDDVDLSELFEEPPAPNKEPPAPSPIFRQFLRDTYSKIENEINARSVDIELRTLVHRLLGRIVSDQYFGQEMLRKMAFPTSESSDVSRRDLMERIGQKSADELLIGIIELIEADPGISVEPFKREKNNWLEHGGIDLSSI